jgi:cytochrome c oxidase subunit I
MVAHDSGANIPEDPQRGSLSIGLFRTDHKSIGLQYLWLALLSVFVGMIMSLAMRIHLVWPAVHLPLFSGGTREGYAALTLLHGSLMVFVVLSAAPQAGFGNYLLPIQIGARDMAFPRLNLVAFWATVVSVLGISAAFFLEPDTGISVWSVSVTLFCAASLANALNFSVTVIDLRTKGMTLPRLPITVWAWFINAILSLLISSVLLAACVYLLADRILGTHFFNASGFMFSLASGSPYGSHGAGFPVLWQRLFWFFAQAQVYVAMLPCFGITTHLLATFSRRAVWAQRAVVLALCAVGLCGFYVWGQHMFAVGLNPYAPMGFSLLASSLGLPASILVMSWLGTLWDSKIRFTTATLFALGFVSLFLSGGMSGLFLARQDFAAASASDEFIAGHYHLVMGVASTFALLAALFFWFPKMFGRSLNERLGKIHFWLTFIGVYCVFMPMHWLGLAAHLSPMGSATGIAVAGPSIRSFITVATLFTIGAQLVFVANLVFSLRRSAAAVRNNPWCATTLEWSLPSPPPRENFHVELPTVYRGAYEFGMENLAEDGSLQNMPLVQHDKPSVGRESVPPDAQVAEAS